MDVYLSTVSNRLNVVLKQLTIIATIFLPLSWLTGFFGQNFGFEVHHISGWASFVGLGLGTELAALAGLLVLLQAPRLVLTTTRRATHFGKRRSSRAGRRRPRSCS